MGTVARPTRRSDVVIQRADETVVLLNLSSGQYYTLNEIGGRIWDLSDGSRTVEEIARTLAEEYEAPEEEIQADVVELLGDLKRDKLVE